MCALATYLCKLINDMSYLLFSGLNGMKAGMDGDKKQRRNYKLLVDPMIRGGSQKIYRFDGIDPTVMWQE